MKKIFNQLKKLFKDKTIVIEHSIARYTTTSESEIYKVYITDYTIYTNGWSPEFKTLKELDKHLSEKIENYKRVYND